MLSRTAFVMVFATAIGCGVVSGMLYGFSTGVMIGLGRLPPAQGAAAMNAINVAVINPAFLGMFLGTALLCFLLAIGSFAVSQHLPHPRLVLVASLFYLVGTFGVTMAFNVPLNDQLGRSPQCWLRQCSQWRFYPSKLARIRCENKPLRPVSDIRGRMGHRFGRSRAHDFTRTRSGWTWPFCVIASAGGHLSSRLTEA